MRYYKLSILLVGFLALSCSKLDKTENQIKKLPVKFEVHNFSKAFSQAEAVDDIQVLQDLYPSILGGDNSAKFWLAMARDTNYRKLQGEINFALEKFPLEEDFESLLQHQAYYFEDLPSKSDLFLMIGDGDPAQKVLGTWSSIAVCMDFYLGSDSNNYDGFSSYQKAGFDSKYLMRDIALEMNRARFSKARTNLRTFIEKMVDKGRRNYVVSQLVPSMIPNNAMNYTEEQINWAEANEFAIWSYFLEHDLLFQSDRELERRFIDPAPFSKFYLDIDRETPGSLGVYIGYEIVDAYMRKKDVSLQELLNTPTMEIFQDSNFKPKKG